MSIYRDENASLEARIASLQTACNVARERLADDDVLAQFIEKAPLEALAGAREAADNEADLRQRATALERYLEALDAFALHAADVEQAIAKPTGEATAFASIRPSRGHLALPFPLSNEMRDLEDILRDYGIEDIDVEEGAEERLGDTSAHTFSASSGFVTSPTMGTRTLIFFVQARFVYDGVPLMIRHEAGSETQIGLCKGFQIRCGVPRAIGDIWVRKEGLADKLWHKPIRRIADITFDDPEFDKAFVISGDEVGAKAALGEAQRRCLTTLHGARTDVELNIAGGVACIVLPRGLADDHFGLALNVIAPLHRTMLERHLVRRHRDPTAPEEAQ